MTYRDENYLGEGFRRTKLVLKRVKRVVGVHFYLAFQTYQAGIEAILCRPVSSPSREFQTYQAGIEAIV